MRPKGSGRSAAAKGELLYTVKCLVCGPLDPPPGNPDAWVEKHMKATNHGVMWQGRPAT